MEQVLTTTKRVEFGQSRILTQKASQFSSDVKLIHKEKTYDLKSILGIISANISENEEITLQITGNDEEKALKELVELF